jgi:predicted acyltransferase
MQQHVQSEVPTTDKTASSRVLSIDALRGFDMFWIMGADTLVKKLLVLVPATTFAGASTAWVAGLADQFEHVEWEGFRFYDLIFPLFLMLVGCSIPFSLNKLGESKSKIYMRILRRTFLLMLMGLIYNGIQNFDWDQLRWMGVLQRIGICYGIAALLAVHIGPRGLFAVWVAILLGYWGILTWVPVPGGTAGDLTPAGNLSGYLDRTLLPGKILEKYYGYGDNEGLLSTIPAVATVLLGIGAGRWLQSGYSKLEKASGLMALGAALVILGSFWGNYFPIIKNLWTSSFVLVAGGWSLMLLSVFYGAIDVLGFRGWAWLWIVIGANAITIYMLQRIVPFGKISEFFLKGIANLEYVDRDLVLLAGALVCKCTLLIVMYKKRMFLRL